VTNYLESQGGTLLEKQKKKVTKTRLKNIFFLFC